MHEISSTGVFVIKDDLNLKDYIAKEIFSKENIAGIELEIQSCLKACFNSKVPQFYSPMRENKSLAMYANLIPVVCDESISSGVLFLVGNNLHSLPNDFDDVTRIYNRIIANWLNRYNDCITHRING